MPTRHIALVPEFGLNPSELARVSAALQKQVTRDLAPVWEVSATVDSFPSLEDVPAGYWPIVVTFRALASEAGIHIDRNGHPYALVEMCPSWSVTASHICLEMVTDPFGSRTFPGVSPRSDQGDVEFSGGICDPCEHPDYAYLVNDVLVSDFCTPAFFEPTSKERRCFSGSVQDAFDVLPGGHLCWYDPATNGWWIRRHHDGLLDDVELGLADPERGSVREFIDRRALHLLSTKMTLEQFEARVGSRRQRSLRASQSRAYWLRASLGHATGGVSLEFDDEVHQALNAARASRAHPMVGELFTSAHANRGAEASSPTRSSSRQLADAEDPDLDPTVVVLEGRRRDADVVQELSRSLERVQAQIRDMPSHVSQPDPAPRPTARTAPPPLPATIPSAAPSPPPTISVVPGDSNAPTATVSTSQGASIAPAAVSVPPRAVNSQQIKTGQSNRAVFISSLAAACLTAVVVVGLRNAWPLRGPDASGTGAAGAPNSMPVLANGPAEGIHPSVVPTVLTPANDPGSALRPPSGSPVAVAVDSVDARSVLAGAAAVSTAPPRPGIQVTAAAIRPSLRAKPLGASADSGTAEPGARHGAAEGVAARLFPPAIETPAQATRSSEPIEGLLEDRR
jgi:hypothetical protein